MSRHGSGEKSTAGPVQVKSRSPEKGNGKTDNTVQGGPGWPQYPLRGLGGLGV